MRENEIVVIVAGAVILIILGILAFVFPGEPDDRDQR